MATKAERFKARQERSGKKRAPTPKRAKPVMDPRHTATRNAAKRVNDEPGPLLEDSMSGKPSRKSSRKVHGGVRADNPLMRAARDKAVTPRARNTRAKAARK